MLPQASRQSRVFPAHEVRSFGPARARGLESSNGSVPPRTGPYSDPEALLKVSKRGLQAHAQLFPDWRSLFLATGPALKEQGLAPKERRYLLWYLEKFRQGGDPAEYDIAPKPRKKIRGWGPAVQHGVRIRP